jgi:hypothetical protein
MIAVRTRMANIFLAAHPMVLEFTRVQHLCDNHTFLDNGNKACSNNM